MNKSARKGCKPYVLKIAIVAMSLWYVFGPLHHELSSWVHALTHQLGTPEATMVHDHVALSDYQEHAHHLSASKSDHNHKFLEFLDRILKASDLGENQEDSTPVSFKIHKHIKTNNFNKHLTAILPELTTHLFLFKKQKIKKGFKKGIIEPPQSV